MKLFNFHLSLLFLILGFWTNQWYRVLEGEEVAQVTLRFLVVF